MATGLERIVERWEILRIVNCGIRKSEQASSRARGPGRGATRLPRSREMPDRGGRLCWMRYVWSARAGGAQRPQRGRAGPAGATRGSQSGAAGDSLCPGHLPFWACDAVGTAAELWYVLSLSSLRQNLTFSFSWTPSGAPCNRLLYIIPGHTSCSHPVIPSPLLLGLTRRKLHRI